ncbi:hypothetical protein KJ780_04445 [Candidatus Micrarchaeota archaeon]|nr:hypothetical protein [Candidatus Micrarchaeota archaeon]
MKRTLALFPLFLLAFGCITPPTPLNETSYLPPHPDPAQIQPVEFPTQTPGQIKCTISLSTQNITFYMDGEKMRSDYLDPESGEIFTTITDGQNYYEKGGQAGSLFENCSWVLMDMNMQGNPTSPEIGMPSNLNFSSMPECRPASFGEEVFEITGGVCNFSDIFSDALYVEMDCDILTDPETKAQCIKYKGE